jgi:hypothetical protein
MIRKDNKIYSQKGVSLIITLFVMIIILAVVISISALLYSEAKIMRNLGNSIVGLYGADSGIEKVLYYDRWVVPSAAARGLCSMFDIANNPVKACKLSGGGDSSIYCAGSSLVAPTSDPTGCDPSKCDDCTVSFNTTLDSNIFNNPITYITSAKVYSDSSYGYFVVTSKGAFGDAGRQVQISIKTAKAVLPNP